jgi:hypothetical protein
MIKLTDAELETVMNMLRGRAAYRRRRGTGSGFIPKPGKQNADLVAAEHLETIISKLETDQ